MPTLREFGPSTMCLRQRILWLWSGGLLWLLLRLCGPPRVLRVCGSSLFRHISCVRGIWRLLWRRWVRIWGGSSRRAAWILWLRCWCQSWCGPHRLWISRNRRKPCRVAQRLWLSCCWSEPIWDWWARFPSLGRGLHHSTARVRPEGYLTHRAPREAQVRVTIPMPFAAAIDNL
jgi:hypothetical protein